MKRFSYFNTLIVAVFSLAFGVLIASRLDLTPKPYAENGLSGGGPVAVTSPKAYAAAKGLSDAFVEVSDHVKPAVVNITTSTKQRLAGGPRVFQFGPGGGGGGNMDDFFKRFFGGEDPMDQGEQKPQGGDGQLRPSGQGSGFIVDSAGFILTNAHVVKGADLIEVKVGSDNEEDTYQAEVVGVDDKTDLAVIKIKPKTKLPFVQLGNSDVLRVGEWVVAIGNPFGVGKTVTTGILSARERSIGYGPYDDYLQTDASINPGNSGGPLVNLHGEVVGVNAAIYTPSGGFVGIGFAIPSNLAKDIYSQLKTKGKVTRGWLGVYIGPVNKEVAEALNLPGGRGVLVKQVIPGSPSEKAGIKDGDVVIEYDGTKLLDDKHLLRLVANTPVGKTVPAKVFRDSKTVNISIKVALRDEEAIAKGDYTGSESQATEDSKLGLTVRDLDEKTRKALPRPDITGVIVTSVQGGGPADRAGVKTGDIIKSINRVPTPTTASLPKALGVGKKGSHLLEFVREGITDFTVVKMD